MLTPPTAPKRPRAHRKERDAKMRECKYYLDPPVEEAFHAYCQERGIERSMLVRRLIEAHMKREGVMPRPPTVELKR